MNFIANFFNKKVTNKSMLRKYIILIILTSCIFQISKASSCEPVRGLIAAMQKNDFEAFRRIYKENESQRCTLTVHLHKDLPEAELCELAERLTPEFKSFFRTIVTKTCEEMEAFKKENPGYVGAAAEYYGKLLPDLVDRDGRLLDRSGRIIKPRK